MIPRALRASFWRTRPTHIVSFVVVSLFNVPVIFFLLSRLINLGLGTACLLSVAVVFTCTMCTAIVKLTASFSFSFA